MNRPTFYSRTGSPTHDLVALLHLPYTAWHLSYVAIGAALAPSLDWSRLAGTLVAFALGLGVGAHALDELKGRPLGTSLTDRALLLLGVGSLAAAMALGLVGAFVISPWVALVAVMGVALAAAYSLEWPHWLHTDLGFALAWGAFPVLVGYWAQTLTLSPSAWLAAVAASLLSLTQRSLSTPARFVRRQTERAEAEFGPDHPPWDRAALLATWEKPLRLLAPFVVAMAVALLATHL